MRIPCLERRRSGARHCSSLAAPTRAAESEAALGRAIYAKANCVGCHKWHGGGGGGYGGAALSLRKTELDRSRSS